MKGDGYLCGIDVGTGSVRVGLFDLLGHPVQFCMEEYPTHFPHPGWAEQNPEDWWNALRKASRECLRRANLEPREVMAVSVTATCATVFPADHEGTALRRAILWMDSRAHAEVEAIATSKHPVLQYSGGEDALEWMVPKVLWLKKNEPTLYKKADKIFDCLDWILYRLTQKWTGSMCNTTIAWNHAKPLGGWPTDFFLEIGLHDVLEKWPEKILFMGDYIGGLTMQAADWLGLQSGIPVAQGGIDSHAGMIGVGVVRPGTLAMILGSSTAHLALSDRPVYVPGLWGPYPEPVIRHQWLIQGGQNSTGSIITWLKDNLTHRTHFGSSSDENQIFQTLEKKAASIAAGSEGLILLDDWQGNRSPYRDPLARGAVIGLSLGHTEAHVFRAALEGTAYGTRNILERCAQHGLEAGEIRVCGGGVKSSLWLQIHADVCNISISTTKVAEASALGAAICAAVGAGVYISIEEASDRMVQLADTITPNEHNANVYSYYFQKYKEAYTQLRDIMHELVKHG